MSKYVTPKQFWAIISAHLYISAVSFIIGTFLLIGVITNPIGAVIFSVVSTILYFFTIYNAAEKVALKDKKPYTKEEPYKLKGLVLPIGLFVINVLLYLLYFVSWKFMTIDGVIVGVSGWINNILFILWSFPFTGFIDLSNGMMNLWGYIIISVLPFIASGAGYFAAMKGFDITSKFNNLVYEKKDGGKK